MTLAPFERIALTNLSSGPKAPSRGSTTQRTYSRLERKALVERAVKDTVFGKRKAWALTDAGRAAIAPGVDA